MRPPRVFFLLLLSALTVEVSAQFPTHPVLGEAPFDTEPEHLSMEKFGQWPGYVRGFYREIATDGDRLYVAARNGGMHVFDLDDPMAPSPVTDVRVLDGASDIFIDGNRLYALDGQRFEIFDASPAGAPAYLGGVFSDDGLQAPRDFAAADGFIYFDVFRGMRVLDSNELGSKPDDEPTPTTPLYDDQFIVTTIHREGGLLLTSGPSGMRFFDLSTPSDPTQIWDGVLATGVTDIDGDGDIVVLASGAGLIFVDVLDPTFPFTRSVVADTEQFIAVAMDGDYAVGLTQFQIHAFDISDPGAPVPLGIATSTEPLWEATIVDQHAYVTAGDGGLLSIDLTKAIPADPATGFADIGRTSAIEIQDELAFVVDGPRGVFVLDITDPSMPVELAQIPNTTSIEPTQIQVSSGRLYVGIGADGILIYDVSTDPGNPTLLGGTDEVGAFDAVGDRLYVARGEDGLVILDAFNPAAITELGSFPANTPASFNGIDVVGSLAYIASGASGIHVVDLAIPSLPTLRGVFDIPTRVSTGLQAFGNTLIVELRDGDDEPSMEFFDISSPLHPFSQRRVDICCGVGVSGSTAFMSQIGFRVHAIDISFPDYPVSVGGYDTFGSALEVEAVGDKVYVANGSAGLLILEAKPFEGEISNPRFEDEVFSFDVEAPERNLFRVRASTDLRQWAVPNSAGFFEKHFIGTGSPVAISTEDDLDTTTPGPRHFFHLRAGAGLILDPFYVPPE